MTAKEKVLEKYPSATGVRNLYHEICIRTPISSRYWFVLSEYKRTEAEAWENAAKRIEEEENDEKN